MIGIKRLKGHGNVQLLLSFSVNNFISRSPLLCCSTTSSKKEIFVPIKASHEVDFSCHTLEEIEFKEKLYFAAQCFEVWLCNE